MTAQAIGGDRGECERLDTRPEVLADRSARHERLEDHQHLVVAHLGEQPARGRDRRLRPRAFRGARSHPSAIVHRRTNARAPGRPISNASRRPVEESVRDLGTGPHRVRGKQ